MRTINKYLTESVVKLNQPDIKRLVSARKPGVYEIDGKKVSLTIANDTMILQYPSNFYELTYILIDISDSLKYKYQQIGFNSKKEMKFIIDMEK